MKFIVEFTSNAPSGPTFSLQELDAETLEMATTKVSDLIKGTDIDSAVIYTPRVALQAERRVNVSEIAPTGSVPRAAGSTVLKAAPDPVTAKSGDGTY